MFGVLRASHDTIATCLLSEPDPCSARCVHHMIRLPHACYPIYAWCSMRYSASGCICVEAAPSLSPSIGLTSTCPTLSQNPPRDPPHTQCRSSSPMIPPRAGPPPSSLCTTEDLRRTADKIHYGSVMCRRQEVVQCHPHCGCK
jgi:hypothetical protein